MIFFTITILNIIKYTNIIVKLTNQGVMIMGSFSIWHWVIVGVVVLVLFGGGGKISQIMGDFGKGLKSFKKNVKEDKPEELANNTQTSQTTETDKQETSKS